MILHILTCVLIVLKLLNHIDISWWFVFAPSLLSVALFVTAFFGLVAVYVKAKL